MATLKTLLTFLLAGAFFGGAAGSWMGPRYIAWYNSPGIGTHVMCDMPTVVQDVTSQLMRFQLIGSGVGGLLFLVLGVFFVRARAKR